MKGKYLIIYIWNSKYYVSKMCHSFISLDLSHSPDFIDPIKHLSMKGYSRMSIRQAPDKENW